MKILKNNNDPDGIEFENALIRARYVYPSPENPNAQSIIDHAKQIYDSEMLERSLSALEDFVPVTYSNVKKYLEENISSRLLKKQSSYTMTKQKKTVVHTREIWEYPYEFLDIIHTPTKSVIECKVHKDDSGADRQRKKILKKYNNSFGPDPNDYYLLCRDDGDSFFVDQFLSINNFGKFIKHNFKDFVENGREK